jgi:hypothetical protein
VPYNQLAGSSPGTHTGSLETVGSGAEEANKDAADDNAPSTAVVVADAAAVEEDDEAGRGDALGFALGGATSGTTCMRRIRSTVRSACSMAAPNRSIRCNTSCLDGSGSCGSGDVSGVTDGTEGTATGETTDGVSSVASRSL